MSVEETKIIDLIGVDKESGQVILSISDHLEWKTSDEHLLLLQEKINSYLRFIESGEINESYPDALNRHAIIRICAMHEPDKKGLHFLAEVKKIVEGAGFGFEFEQRYRSPGCGLSSCL